MHTALLAAAAHVASVPKHPGLHPDLDDDWA